MLDVKLRARDGVQILPTHFRTKDINTLWGGLVLHQALFSKFLQNFAIFSCIFSEGLAEKSWAPPLSKKVGPPPPVSLGPPRVVGPPGPVRLSWAGPGGEVVQFLHTNYGFFCCHSLAKNVYTFDVPSSVKR